MLPRPNIWALLGREVTTLRFNEAQRHPESRRETPVGH